MNKLTFTTATILIAADNVSNAGMVRKLLQDEYQNVFASTDPALIAQDFERHRPAVLVLAFDALENAERYYLGLYRLCPTVQQHSHRTVILCNKDQVKRVYDLCKKSYFDDYVLFWPMTYDMSRLGMAVHHALRELAVFNAGGPTVTEFAAQARRIAELETLLDERMAKGDQHIDLANTAIARAEQHIGTALDGFTQRLTAGGLGDAVIVANADALNEEISRFKQQEIFERFRVVDREVGPLKAWANEFRQGYAPLMQSVRALKVMANEVRPVILLVDDDELQQRIVGKALEGANYSVLFALHGIDALNVLRKSRPDVILMDVMMPQMDGIETTRRIMANPQLAGLKVIMMTGKSENKVVIDSLKAGAVDFVVKPIDRDTLLEKLARVLAA